VRFLLALFLCASVARADDTPLLVVLHGDGERAAVAAKRWQAAAKKRGWKLLALQCPRTEHCKDSWWKWNGDPQWLRDQVAAVTGVDATRIYAAGWSGGATYLGMRAAAWSDTFAAVVIHGGGMAPAQDTCPARALPAYFLVGDKNPLHHLAVALHEFFARCTNDVVWDLVKGADHAKEHRALDPKKALAILDWLGTHTRK
jgi:poly(3-hydroxybutyrate) depolymerase